MALVALVALVYAPVLEGVFVWDDHALIETNDVVQRGSLREIFSRPYWTASSLSDVRPSYYRPITTLTLRADFAMAGTEAASFHVSNLLMHLLATIAVVLVARRFGASPLLAVVAAGVWALHPRSTEAVAWVSGRTDVLAGGLALAALGFWPWYGESGNDTASAPTRREQLRAALAGLALLAGLLCKEVAVAAVVAIVVGTAVGTGDQGRARWRRIGQRLAWLVVPLAAYAALRSSATRGLLTSQLAPLGTGRRAATVLEALGRYLAMALVAWHPATSIGLVGEIDAGSVVLGSIVLAFFVALMVRGLLRMRRPTAIATRPSAPAQERAVVAAVAALGLSSLGLVVHVVPIALAAGVAADRLLYLPLAALAIAVAVGASRLSPSRRRAFATVGGALAVSFVPFTRARADDYTNELKFRVVAAEQAHPGNTSAKSSLATLLRADAELDLACRLHASARRTLERTGRTDTQRYVRAMENLGGCYAAQGAYEAADGVYAVVLRMDPNRARLHMELGYLRLHTFAFDLAERELRRAVELDAHLAPARSTLLALPGIRRELARLDTEEARRADPEGWAHLLTTTGRIADATKAWGPLVTSPSIDEDPGWEGLQHLLAHADLATAERAAAAVATRRAFGWNVGISRAARRRAEQARIDALRARIDALANSEQGAPQVER